MFTPGFATDSSVPPRSSRGPGPALPLSLHSLIYHLVKRLFLLALSLLPMALSAQIDARLSLAQEAYLPGESLEAAVQISNFTGRRLTFGREPLWLRFNIEAIEGSVVNQLSDIAESGAFSLDPSTRGTIRYDLQPHFDLSRPGRYRLTAIIVTPDREEVISSPVNFEVIRGSRLWEREIGLPGTAGNEQRKYLLQQANYLKEVRLYVRITDLSESVTFKVIPLGRMVSFARPQPVVDRKSQLHILNQITAEDYMYMLITPEGVVTKRETYGMILDRRPQIRMNDEGDAAVIGGERHRKTSDAPVAPVPAKAAAKTDESAHEKTR